MFILLGNIQVRAGNSWIFLAALTSAKISPVGFASFARVYPGIERFFERNAVFARIHRMRVSLLHGVQDWDALAKDAGYCAKTMAALCQASPERLRRFFRTRGLPLKPWLTTLQMEDAFSRLRKGTPVKRVVSEVGLKNRANFIQKFRRYFGKSPSRVPRG